ncbi:unnamed protein product [Prorocentrum cordatum]|uniref:Uncharacterized protein n=1 Tax=Prorocentrum cordatum TaxID=2364126 RepID=A0ABN9WXS8_9DINO|nr:unnamed protein product [Polarella glacialis]
MSFLLNLVTVQNAELLGTPLPRRAAGTPGAAKAGPDLQPLMRGLFGHCAALASLVGELFRSDLGVPHDVTNAVLNTSRALLQPHLNTTLSAQRRSCAFILLEGLMCLGTDWVGQRLTTLFALWKAALGKKPVDRAKVLHQQHVASASQDGGPGQESSSGACRDELLSLLCALRSLHAFTLHSHDTLLVSLPHLHKILVVFLTHVSQLVVALPHPTSASFRAKCRNDSATPGHARPTITLAVHCGIPDVLLMIRSTMYRCFAVTQYSQRFVPLLNMLADDVTRPLPLDFPVADFVAHYLNSDDVVLDLVDPYMDSSRDSAATVRLATARLLSTSLEGSRTEPGSSSHDPFCDAASSGFFSGAPREGPGSIDGMLTPWDAWADPKKTMASQGSSPEWEWRCSAVALLAIIMNSSEVSEAPRSAVLTHLLKKRESAEDSSGGHGKKGSAPQCEVSVVASVAILVYLREHARARGIKCGLPAAPAEQILQVSLEGLRDANPAIRRLHVEILSLLFYIHHRLPESPIVPSILQFLGQESSSDSAPVRSALALLCGSVLRAFEWGGALQSPPGAPRPQGIQCPYLINIVPCLLKLAKETAQPVRLWMLHGLHLSMQAAKLGFSPFLKECLRLATAHLLADFFESPLVLWTIGELLHSAAAMPPAEADTGGANLREERVGRARGGCSADPRQTGGNRAGAHFSGS